MSVEKIFGETPAQFLSTIEEVLPTFSGTRYRILSIDEFKQLTLSNPSKGAQIYWREILYRAHLAAASSMARGHRWLTGAVAAADAGYYLPFAACLRGFVEAAADSYDSLAVVSFTLADNYGHVREALEGASTSIALCPDIENALIHFTFARKLTRDELKTEPDTHQAKTAAEYLGGLVKAKIPEIEALYRELCGLTHPSAESVGYYVFGPNGVEFEFTLARERPSISGLLQKYQSTFLPLLSFAFNPATLILGVLLEFPMTELWCQPLKTWNLSGIGGWNRIQRAIHSAKST